MQKRSIRRRAGWCLAVLAVLGLNGAVLGGVIATESFDYSGAALGGQNGGTGWNGAWSGTSIAVSQDDTSLVYPCTFESPLAAPAPVGERAVSSGGTDGRLLATPLDLTTAGNSYYVSALVEQNVAGKLALLQFHHENLDGVRRFGLGINSAGEFWLGAVGATSTSQTATLGETYLLVARLVTGQESAYMTSLKVFGPGMGTEVPAAEPTGWDLELAGTSSATLAGFNMRAGPGGEFDEIRIGTTWASVVPEPASLVLLALGMVVGLRRR